MTRENNARLMCLVSRTACMIMCASACFLTAELDVLLCSDGLAHAEILKTRQGGLQLRSPGLCRLLRQQGARKAPRWHLCQTLMYQPGQRIESRPQFACFAVRFMSSLMEHTSCWTQDAVGCTRRGKPSWLPAVLWRYVDVVLDSAWFLDPVLGPPKIALVDCLST